MHASPITTLFAHVVVVVCARSNEQMLRIAALRVITTMQNTLFYIEYAHEQLIRHSMSKEAYLLSILESR